MAADPHPLDVDHLHHLKWLLKQWQAYQATGRMAVTRDRAIADLTREIEEFENTCRRCGGEMGPGIAMGQTYAAGSPDDIGAGVTMSAGGPGEVIRVRKCRDCGWSVGDADD